MPEIKKIVLTGGPCAGKTTALVKITEYFSGFGYKVFNVPEVPTIYSTAGWNYLTPNRDLYYQGERAILETQLAFEDQFMRLAEVCTRPVLIVCDRGTMDISAYIKPEEWEEITAMAGTTPNALMERYDAVLHLVSATRKDCASPGNSTRRLSVHGQAIPICGSSTTTMISRTNSTVCSRRSQRLSDCRRPHTTNVSIALRSPVRFLRVPTV